MYFVHPQIKLNNLNKAISALISQPDVRAFTRKLFVYFPKKQIIFTDMGRSAFRIIIEKFKLENSEIIFPAYICDIFYPILKNYNIKPVFIDIDLKNFNIKSEDINKKISPKTKAILISHTYGFPFDLAGLRKTLGGKLLIIEDCAHS
ncbi:MAG: DegT/DnrJ/EryC1/StrS family aminotransferase, partial [Candidatus Parcubacteria bacterium]|nr:DegT/DnrJ/EryC1/StrS family aminotransferase [Candidatus Parcubacteria bacterium]